MTPVLWTAWGREWEWDWRRTHEATRRLLERLAASDVGPLREHVAA